MTEGYKTTKIDAEATKQIADTERLIGLMEPSLIAGKEDEFLGSISARSWIHGETFSYPSVLERKLMAASVVYNLSELKKAYDIFVSHPSHRNLEGLDAVIEHGFRKASQDLEFMAKKYPDQFADIDQDFLECDNISFAAFDPEIVPNPLKRPRPIEGESEQDFLARAQPSAGSLLLKIEEILNKYPTDERFSVDPIELVAEIREDVAKYRQEHPKS